MRDVNGLETTVSGINGVVHNKQFMFLATTKEIHFEDEIRIDQLFSTSDQKYVAANTRCMVHIYLRYSWDSDTCPDFEIVLSSGGADMTSKEGLDDYPRTLNSAETTFIVEDVTGMMVRLVKSDVDITKFKLYKNSFIKIDVL